jgi:hypothetical protein
MTIEAGDVADLVTTTLRDLGKMHWTCIAEDLQNYEMMNWLLKRDRVMIEDGRGIQRTIMDSLLGAARHKGLYEEDPSGADDHLFEITCPWRHADTFFQVHYVTDVLMNRGKAMVNNVIKPKRAGSRIDLAKELEEHCWASPAVGDKLYPRGIPYWMVANATEGFNGGYPGSHTDIGGISLTDHPNYKNWTFTYSNITDEDSQLAMRKAYQRTQWKSPVTVPEFHGQKGQRYRVYVSGDTQLAMEDVATKRNDNLGADIGLFVPFADQVTFKRFPIVYVPYLDDNESAINGASLTGYIYMLDRACLYPVVLEGDYLRETTKQDPRKHNLTQTITELTYNFIMTDRRTSAVGYAA